MGKKGNKRKTRWRVLPIGGDDADCLYSTNEDDCEADYPVTSQTAANGPGSYARAAQPGRGKLGSKPRSSGYQPAYYRPHRTIPEIRQPLVTSEKKTFNEEEYTKITTPRQDVLFKKGYLGRKKTVTSSSTTSAPAATVTTVVTGASLTATNCIELAPMHNEVAGDCEPTPAEQTDVMSPVDEQPQYIYPNGYVDGVIYVNGGYEWYDPYGNVTVVVGPAPPFAGPGGGAPVLAAVPCQPLPLQPIEWFNPAYGVPYVAPTLPSCPRERSRRKRSSADSQNCSPQSSESTDPPGSPQDGEGDREVEGEVECEGEDDAEIEDGMLPALPGVMDGTDDYAVYSHGHPVQPHPVSHPYMYPGAYMFGPPIYNINGITVQSTSQLPQNTDNSGSTRRKKKRRRRRRRGGVDNGSEETSSDEKDMDEPFSLTSQESSQEVESDSKNSVGSASCPTIVGGPELPERTPESPLSSPSLSPSSSSPSPSNATENKTALPKVNYVEANSQQQKNIRSEDIIENSGTLESKISSEDVNDNNSLFSYIPNVENADYIHKLKVKNLQISNKIQNGDSNANPLLVIDAFKTNGNHPVDGGKYFEVDNNIASLDSYTVSTIKNFELGDSADFNNECPIKNNTLSLKQKTKGKKGMKPNKQKVQHLIQNGFSEIQIEYHSLKTSEVPTEIDRNESGGLMKDKSSPAGNQIQSSSKQVNASKDERETLSRNVEHTKDGECKSKEELLSAVFLSLEVPKKLKTTSSHHRQHQQIMQQLNCLAIPQQMEDETLNVSLVLPNERSIPVENTPLCSIELQPGNEIEIDNAVSYISECERKLTEKDYKDSPKVDSMTATIELCMSDMNKSANSLVDEQINKISIEDETNKFMKFIEKGGSFCRSNFVTTVQEINELSKGIISEPPLAVQKNTCKFSISGDLHTSEMEKSCDTNKKNNSFIQKFPSKTPEWVPMTPPIPPPRRKKWHPSRKCSIEFPPTSGRELEVKKLEVRDENSSSSSHESEESIIFLLSSSPNDKSKDSKEIFNEIAYVKQDVNGSSETTSAFEQRSTAENSGNPDRCILPSSNLAYEKDEIEQRKWNEHALKPYEFTMCISKQAQQNSKGDQSRHKLSEFKYGCLLERKTHDVDIHRTCVATAKSYAAILACQVLEEGMSSAATCMNKKHSLSLTEKVTQWLHSQDSDDVLQVPQSLESESENEDMKETNEEEIQMTGPKNVYRNPLLAQSCESKNTCDDAGTRVANLERNYVFNGGKVIDKDITNTLPKKIDFDGNEKKELTKELIDNIKMHCKEVMNYEVIWKESSIFSAMKNREIKNIECEENGVCLTDSTQNILGNKSKNWDSLISELVEYDADWECDSAVLESSSHFLTRENKESHLHLECSEDKCSHMCDPTISVAKYYTLGPYPEMFLNNKYVMCDSHSKREEEDDEDDEGMEALIHFRNEFEENSCTSYGIENTCPPRNLVCNDLLSHKAEEMSPVKKYREFYDSSYDGFTSENGIQSEESYSNNGHKMSNNTSKAISEINKILKHKSTILLSHLGAEGPFPCGGICCILQ